MSPAIRLEPLTPADGPYFYELGSDPQVARYMRFSPLTDPAQGDELAQSYTTGGNLAWRIVDAVETRTHLVYSGAPGRDAKEAITRYRVLCSGGGYALLEVDLETGRKNQIRVHMSDLGHPIAGDRQYGAQSRPLGRLCLHAHELTLVDPRTGEERTFSAKEPAAFRRLCRGGSGEGRR